MIRPGYSKFNVSAAHSADTLPRFILPLAMGDALE